MRTYLRWLPAYFCLVRVAAAQVTQAADPKELYDRAVADAEHGKVAEAAAQMDSVTHMDAGIPNAWWNLGLWRADLGQAKEALAAWLAYRALDSTDWRAEAKIVQAYQALGQVSQRDSAVADLLAHRKQTRNKELKSAAVFCREQAGIDGHRVMVMQTFEPKGDRMVFVTFYLVDEQGRDTAHYSLGSYDLTTKVARETKDIGPKDRLYHLDYYAGRSHLTLAFYRTPPSYDELRAQVWAAMRGETPPISGTTVSPQ